MKSYVWILVVLHTAATAAGTLPWTGGVYRPPTFLRYPPANMSTGFLRPRPCPTYGGARREPFLNCSSGRCYPYFNISVDGKLQRILERYQPPKVCPERQMVYTPPFQMQPSKAISRCSDGRCNKQSNTKQDRSILLNVDSSIDPCEDFYSYVCGSWNFHQDIPPDKEEYTVFDMLTDRKDQRVEEMFAQHKLDNHQSKGVRNAAQLYYGCMDLETREKVGLAPLLRLLTQLGGYPMLEGPDPNLSGNWLEVALNIKLQTGLGVMINVQVLANPTDSRKKIIAIGYPSTEMELRDWRQRFKEQTPVQWIEQYNYLVRDSAILLGAKDSSYLYEDAAALTRFEMTLLTMDASQHDSKMLTIKELVETYRNINWTYLFKLLFDIDVETTSQQKILVDNSAYLRYLNQQVLRIPYRTMANYMLWVMIMQLAPETTQRMRETIFKYTKNLYGTKQMKPLHTLCTTTVETFMALPISALYVRKYFTEQDKQEVLNILKEIHATFKETIRLNNWMDDETKKVAFKKMEAMSSVVGYPEWIFDEEEVESIYEAVGDLDSNRFFDSLQQVKAALVRNKLMQWNDVNHRVDASYSLGNPLMVNAFYSVWANTMFYPAALLDYPIYRNKGPLVVNFGAIGTILGHELTHAFDKDGSVVGPEGNFHDWWTANSKKNFEMKVRCFIEQYDRYNRLSAREKAGGQKTVNDNIADNGGLQTSYKAFKSYIARNEHLIPLQRIPGMNATMDQLFFIAFGNVWCGKSRAEYLRSQSGQSAHSPNNQRVTGSLSNMKEFSDAFGCRQGSRMNPEKKCVLW